MNEQRANIKDSQNFLHDEELVSLLISKSSLGRQDIVYEIGAGKGIITKRLAASCKRVIAIEFDAQMAQALKLQFESDPNVEIVCADFLHYEIAENEKYKLFSNIPFNITADILSKVLALEGIQDVYFIMQYEAFLKYSGMPYYSDCLKSLLYKPFYKAELVYEFAPTDFTPAPKARIILARFTPKTEADISLNEVAAYRDFLSFLFAASGDRFSDRSKKIFSYEQLKRSAKTIGFPPSCAIGELTYQQWLAIFEVYLKYVPSEKKAIINGAYSRLLNTQDKLSKVHRNRNREGGATQIGKRKPK